MSTNVLSKGSGELRRPHHSNDHSSNSNSSNSTIIVILVIVILVNTIIVILVMIISLRKVPANCVGLIIGSAGSTIKRLKQAIYIYIYNKYVILYV